MIQLCIMKKERILVTGGSGYVGSSTIVKLLQDGHFVKTTVRSALRATQLSDTLVNAGISSLNNLEFIEADLNDDKNWDTAVAGCDYVLHVASPLPHAEPKNDDDVIIPARDGALRVLKAARDANVKRVVLTSSFAAVGYTINEPGHVFDEADWTDSSMPNPAYIRSKVIAEEAAWDFIENEGGKLELSVIIPTGIFGPVFNNDYSLSIQLIKDILNGGSMENFDFSFGVIDVRDVVLLHLNAMTNPDANGHRFIATSDDIVSCYDIAELIKKERKDRSQAIGSIKPIDQNRRIKISNEKAKSYFNWKPISWKDTILATVDSLPSL